MTNPTTPFSWQMPTASDLVTDLPADFETFGQAVATSMADLLGGTTGQVLSKASNTDMDFTWVTSDDANAIQNAIVDAKGDLIAASAADTPARLAVGTNGQVLTADSTAATGLAWATAATGSVQVAGKNGVINGAMDIWQRGTSISLAASTAYPSGFVADRYQTGTAANQACTISRQPTNDTTNLPFIQYAMRYQRNSGQTGTSPLFLVQNFETTNSIPFAGKTVTFSFYARAGANYSPASSALTVVLRTGTGTDQNLITTGYTGSADAVNTTATLTTTWQRFTYTAAIGATVTELGFLFGYNPTGTAGTNDWYEVTGIQLEVAATATAFARNGSTIQAELSTCQRYFQKSYDQSVTPGTASADSGSVVAYFASNVGNGSPFAWTKLHQTMRTVPTLTIYAFGGGTTRVSDNNNTDLAANSGTVTRTGEGGFGVYNNSGGTIAPGNNGFRFQWTGSAEL